MLPKLEGFAAALLGRLDATALATVVGDLNALETTVQTRGDLSAVLTDTSISNVARGQVLRDLLTGKVSPDALRLSVYAAESVPAQEVPRSVDELAHVARTLRESGEFHHAGLGLLDARRRVAGYADALLEETDTENFSSIEDDLFRWARTVEGNAELRHLLLDRDAALEARLGLTDQLLAGKVNPVSLSLARFTVLGGRPRDVVGTLDYLVNYVAQARDWRVARVHTARTLNDASQSELVGSLSALTGKSVELQIVEEPDLLGGVLVEIGDLRLDATTRGRLGALHDAVASGRILESVVNRND
ncbi:MAG TPA: F0F1 ATP synthase subunit delta [Acidimicrobiales bacterium]|nr:F0F1 ATP synthase subunit delta [Acidimicrobiales bacterium]